MSILETQSSSGCECKFVIFKITKSSFLNNYAKIVLLFSPNVQGTDTETAFRQHYMKLWQCYWRPTLGQRSGNVGLQRCSNIGPQCHTNIDPQHCTNIDLNIVPTLIPNTVPMLVLNVIPMLYLDPGPKLQLIKKLNFGYI